MKGEQGSIDMPFVMLSVGRSVPVQTRNGGDALW